MTSVRFSVRFCKNLRFGFGFTILTAVLVRLGLHSPVDVNASFHLRLYGMTLEMNAELVQLIVSQSDSELEVQRYGMKKNTLTVDPIMLEDEFCMRQRKKPSPNRQSQFFENRTAETPVFSYWILRSVRFGSVRKPISDIFIWFRTPVIEICWSYWKWQWAFLGHIVVGNITLNNVVLCL